MRGGKTSDQFGENAVQESDKSVSAKTVGEDDGSVTTSTKKRTSSSSSTRQSADEEKFVVIEGADQAEAMVGRELTPAGFEVTSFKVLAEACDQPSLYEEAMDGYKRDGTVPNFATLAKLTRECGKKVEQPFKYLAVVMAEVGTPLKEKGEQWIVASIRMNVQNIEKPIPKSIANTEFQSRGNGRTTAEAQGVVMKRAGSQVGKEIRDMLNAKGLN